MTLPHGFVVQLDRRTRVVDGGRSLLGGFPTRLVRLTERARPLVTGRRVVVKDAASALLADRLLETGLAHPVTAELPPHPDPRWTVVVPVRDRPRELDRLLTSLGTAHPVIVVDDASYEPAAVGAVAARHGALLVPLDVNVGPAAARNAGLRLVRTPYVAFVDSDVVLPATTIPTLLGHFADPKVAMAVPRIAGLRTEAAPGWLTRYEEARSSLDLGAEPAQVRPGSPVSWASTTCVLARVDALAEGIGGFDDGMRVGEDVDLCWRLVARGLRVRYDPSVTAEHEHRARLGEWFTRKAFYGTGAHPLAVRHPEAIAPVVLAPWSAALIVALLAQRRWSVPAAGALCAVTTVRIARKLDRADHSLKLAARLTANGTVGALSQAGSLLTRHWWPVAAAGCLVSRRVRRAVAVAAVTDIALEYRKNHGHLDPVRFAVARRLDDLAYGAGVWYSAAKGHSLAALRPRIRG